MGVQSLDVAVVGAGIAGLYTAWRLCKAGTGSTTIGLFESSDRVGGRILSVTTPGSASLELDLGARTIADHHVRTRMLADQFGLSTHPCILEEHGNLLHLRGRTRSFTELRRSFLRPAFRYAVTRRGQRRGGGRMLRKARERIAARTTQGGFFCGRPLSEWPLDAILREVLAPDEIAYLTARSAYSFWERPLNAAAIFDWAARELFMPRTPLWMLPDGLSALTRRLAHALESGGVPVRTGRRLTGIELPSRPQEPTTLRFTTHEGAETIVARRVVLALPRYSIERIAPLGQHPALRALMDAVVPWPVTTTALVYPHAWWTPLGFSGGRAVTDLPAGLMHYHGSDTRDPPPRRQAAITFYTDRADAGYWGAVGEPGWIEADNPATVAMHAQVCLVHRQRLGEPLPEPLCAFVQDWAASPSGGAFHLWAYGSDPQHAMASALQPIDNVGLHICGEAWSTRQGWIEGALETADLLLDRHFGFRPLVKAGR